MQRQTIRARIVGLFATSAFAFATFTAPATAEVRFGKNVRIGGHDVSNQTFNSQRRGEFYIYKNNPPKPGCFWRSNGDGSKTKVCHWKRKRH